MSISPRLYLSLFLNVDIEEHINLNEVFLYKFNLLDIIIDNCISLSLILPVHIFFLLSLNEGLHIKEPVCPLKIC